MLNLSKHQPRRILLPVFMLMLILLVVPMVYAQQDGRSLVPGTPVEGTISTINPAQVYTFSANSGDIATINVSSDAGFALTVLLTNASGQSVAQLSDTQGTGTVDLVGIPLPQSGVYYVTVFVTAGVETNTSGTFTISLDIDSPTAADLEETPQVDEQAETTAEAVETPAPTEEAVDSPREFSIGQVLTSSGIQVDLRWDSPDDLNLQVRDPVGGSLFWDSRTTTNGGTFGFDVNGLCEVISPENNVETAQWPAGPVPTGSYEVLIYYRQGCEGGNAPVNFTVDITVDGQALSTLTGTLRPPAPNDFNVFISSFYVNADGTAETGPSGPYTDVQVLTTPASELLALPAQDLTIDVPVEGTILNDAPYQTYRFTASAGEIVSINMNRTAGSLDTLFVVLDSAGNVIDGNDDLQSVVNTDSGLNALRLPTADTYTIVATRYGKDIGGTEGTYTLVLSGQASANLPQQILDLQLPTGDLEITLTWSGNADLRLLVRDPQLNSIYNDAPTSPTGGRLIRDFSNVNCTISPSTPTSYIYWPQGFLLIGPYEVDIWHRNECNDTLPVQFTVYITVNGNLIFSEAATITFDQHYLVGFSVDNLNGDASVGQMGVLGGSETINYQEELASAVSISTGVGVPGSLSGENPFDVYTFEGQAGDVVTLDMRSNGNLDTSLFLLNSAGIEIAANDDANEGTTDSLISNILLTEDGTYTVIATRYGTVYGGTAGPYTLTLRID